MPNKVLLQNALYVLALLREIIICQLFLGPLSQCNSSEEIRGRKIDVHATIDYIQKGVRISCFQTSFSIFNESLLKQLPQTYAYSEAQ